MISINCLDNQSFRVSVVDYQFVNIPFDEYDSNWLRIYINIDSKQGNWESIDPCLLSWEFQELKEWLKDINDNKKVDNELCFIEPNLSFLLIENNDLEALIRIKFDLESKPKNASEDDEYFIDFNLNKQNNDLIGQFIKESKRCPIKNH